MSPAAGTLLVKDASHAGHEQFFATESVLTAQEKLTTADFYQFQPKVTSLIQASVVCEALCAIIQNTSIIFVSIHVHCYAMYTQAACYNLPACRSLPSLQLNTLQGHVALSCRISFAHMWYTPDVMQERKFYEQYKAIPLSAKAGSLFLWDSRTAHQNIMPGILS